MDFLSKLGKKASEAAQMTKDKTTKLSGEIKLKGKINDCKSKISNCYSEIGKMVYENYKNGTPVESDSVKEKYNEIDNLKEEITKAEHDILALNDIKKCVSCNEEIGRDVDFCPKCGKEQPKVEKTAEETTSVEDDVPDLKVEEPKEDKKEESDEV